MRPILVLVPLVACGGLLGADEDADPPAPAAPPASDASAAADASGEGGPSGFCAQRSGYLACEDFDRDLPPAHGWELIVPDGGPSITVESSDRPGAGRAGRLALPEPSGPPAVMRVVPAAGTTKLHLELEAKFDVAKGGEFTLARIFVMDAKSQMRSADLVMFDVGPVFNFCHPQPPSTACDATPITEPLDSWRKIAIDLDTGGASVLTVDGHAYTDPSVASIGPVAMGAVFVGAYGLTKGGNVAWFDDALISSE